MKKAIKEFIVAGIASFTMFYAVIYFGWVLEGTKSWIGFAIFLAIWLYVFVAVPSYRREKAQRAAMIRKVVWNR